MKKYILCVSVLISSLKALACSCVFHDGPAEKAVYDSFQQASTVVLATAEHVENLDPLVTDIWSEGKRYYRDSYYNSQRTQFVAIESWKGGHEKRFFTEIITSCCMCGYSFEVGKTYLLYLYGPDKNGYYRTSSCSRTKEDSDQVKKEIEILNNIGLLKNSKSTLKSDLL